MKQYKFTDEELIAGIKAGWVGVIPTDTVYGLVCSAHIVDSVDRIFQLKRRQGKPGTVLAASLGQIIGLGLPVKEVQDASRYWPNSISVEFRSPINLSYLSQGLGHFSVRIPDDKNLQKFLQLTGPLATSSANLAGEPTATTIHLAMEIFGNLADFYVDGGEMSNSQPSTIIRVDEQGKPKVIRQGKANIELLE